MRFQIPFITGCLLREQEAGKRRLSHTSENKSRESTLTYSQRCEGC